MRKIFSLPPRWLHRTQQNQQRNPTVYKGSHHFPWTQKHARLHSKHRISFTFFLQMLGFSQNHYFAAFRQQTIVVLAATKKNWTTNSIQIKKNRPSINGIVARKKTTSSTWRREQGSPCKNKKANLQQGSTHWIQLGQLKAYSGTRETGWDAGNKTWGRDRDDDAQRIIYWVREPKKIFAKKPETWTFWKIRIKKK